MSELTKAQEEYFKHSKIRNRYGDLLTVYHGSKSKGFDAFEYSPDRQTGTDFGEAYYFTTDYDKAKAYAYDQLKDPRLVMLREKRAEYMQKCDETGDIRYAQAASRLTYQGRTEAQIVAAADYDTGGEVVSAYIDLRNPLIVDAQNSPYYNVYPQYFKEARERGHDGIVALNVSDTAVGEARPMDVFIAFYPDQIKSIDNLLPTRSKNYKDNSEEYAREHSGQLSPDDQFELAKLRKQQELINQRKASNSLNRNVRNQER